jgi:hypothetical protein
MRALDMGMFYRPAVPPFCGEYVRLKPHLDSHPQLYLSDQTNKDGEAAYIVMICSMATFGVYSRS